MKMKVIRLVSRCERYNAFQWFLPSLNKNTQSRSQFRGQRNLITLFFNNTKKSLQN